MNTQPGPCVFVFDCIEWMNAMSSTCCAHVRQQRADHLAALAGRRERPRALHQVAVLALKRDKLLFARQRLAVMLRERRLVVPQVDMRRAARTEDLQHPLRTRRKLRHAAAPSRKYIIPQQTRQPDAGEPAKGVRQKAAPRKHVLMNTMG